MQYQAFASTWLSLQSSNRFLKICCIFLMALNLIALIGWLKKDQAIVLIPPGLSDKSEIAKNSASEGYKKAWALYAATLLGNVSPENADFVLEAMQNMVSGEISAIITEHIAGELDTLKQEKVSSSLEIVRLIYEPETDLVFVTGRNRLLGPGGKSSATEQTMEFKIDVKQYSPIITHLASYAGGAHIKQVKDREEARQKAQLERQKLIKQ
jgi:conjugal transfer pilus assembly protein TraE